MVWDSGESAGNDSIHVLYGGKDPNSRSRYFWRVRIRDHFDEWGEWSETAWFETAFLNQDEWEASWIAPSDVDKNERGPAPALRKDFAITGDIAAARLYITAKGLFEASINGVRVGEDVLVPGWTDFTQRVQYLTYDVTALLQTGKNAIGVLLGDGWYAGRISQLRDGIRLYGARPELLCRLEVRDGKGGRQTYVSDDSWRWTDSPILSSDLYDGEHYDAGQELTGWMSPGYDDQAWQKVAVSGPVASPQDGITIDAKVVEPVRQIKELPAKNVTEPEKGAFVYDLGQNMTGWARLTFNGTTGSTVTIRYAEMLNPDGSMYVENLRSAKTTDTYTFAADGTVTWEPKFTFHGFRYVEVSGATKAPKPEDVVGIVLHNEMPETGRFTSSHPKLNQLQSNIIWGQRGNFLEVPTDCPQRDERLGWTGDAQVFIPTASYNFNVGAFFTKWQRDLGDAQSPRGVVPSVAPVVRYMAKQEENNGGPAWSDAVVICPWTIYKRYGDTAILEKHYDGMHRFISSMGQDSRGLIRSDEFVVPWGGFGDWVAMDAPEGSNVGATPKDLIGTAYFAYSTSIVCRVAELLGKTKDARLLRDLHEKIVKAFRREYVTANGRLVGDTQTSYVLALAFDLLPEEQRQGALDRLVGMIEKRNFRMATGFVGTPLLCPTLTRFDRVDVAYKLLLQEEFPSWLYTVNQGATTMWERWNSWTHEHGFGPVSMNSFNHYAYGSIGAWMYATVAGLDLDLSGRRMGEPPLRIAPRHGEGLDQAEVSLETPFGPAKSSWKIAEGRVDLELVIPPNAWARVEIPSEYEDVVVEMDEEARNNNEELEDLVIHEATIEGIMIFRVTAGRYNLRYRT